MSFFLLARAGRRMSVLWSVGVAFTAVSLLAEPSLVTTNLLLPGTTYATEAYVHDSGKPGPTVFLCGGAHGNEPAGAAAVELIRHWPLQKGKLVAVPRANVPGLAAGKRLIPNLTTNLNNLNRNYPRAKLAEPARGELAQAIWAFALAVKPDWVLDLHEGFDFHQFNEKSVGSSVITFPSQRAKAAADHMVAAVNAGISNEPLRFVRRDQPVDGSLARAAGEHLKVPGMTLETTSKQPLPTRVRQHEIMVHQLLAELGMMDGPLPAESFVEATPVVSPAALRIALYQGPGTGGAGPPNLMRKLNQPPGSSITPVSPETIQAGGLTNFDVVIFGGGSGSKQAAALGDDGRAKVRRFVEQGGGYIGICAGAYLATSGYSWSLNLINARTVSPKWQRGTGTVQLELTETGGTILGRRAGPFDVRYANGPIVKADDKPDLPPFETLAYFRSELARNDSPVGVMVNAPAIFCAPYKQGRVVCVSPHPEQTAGLEEFVPRAVNWVKARSAAGN